MQRERENKGGGVEFRQKKKKAEGNLVTAPNLEKLSNNVEEAIK